ncbi:MAG TPA: hypothetical protein VEI97_03930, partial [bacterium]|nr:hypothetical protein [bacterium]
MNRGDMGYTGRAVFLIDIPEGETANFTFFGTEDVRANPTVLSNADGYIKLRSGANAVAGESETGSFTGMERANTFPYKLLVDELNDPRFDAINEAAISNGGDGEGNYLYANGGWQRSNWPGPGVSPPNTGWTGFDYLHPGQATRLSAVFAVLPGETVTLDVVLLIKYTDPRHKPANTSRYPFYRNPALPSGVSTTIGDDPDPPPPPATPETALFEHWFAYRLPHAAIDVSVITQLPYSEIPPPLQVDPADEMFGLSLGVRDWDSTALHASAAPLDDPTTTAVENSIDSVPPGASDPFPFTDSDPVPQGAISVPALFSGIRTMSSSRGRTGHPLIGSPPGTGDEVRIQGRFSNTLMAPGGIHWGMVKITDPESSISNLADWYFHGGLPPGDTVADVNRAQDFTTYQAFSVLVGMCPVLMDVESSDGAGPDERHPAGRCGQFVSFLPIVSGIPFDVLQWSFGGGATPNTSTAQSPNVQLGTPGTYTLRVTAWSLRCGAPPITQDFEYTVGTPVAPLFAARLVDSATAPNSVGRASAVVVVPDDAAHASFRGRVLLLHERFIGGVHDIGVHVYN